MKTLIASEMVGSLLPMAVVPAGQTARSVDSSAPRRRSIDVRIRYPLPLSACDATQVSRRTAGTIQRINVSSNSWGSRMAT